MTLLSAANCRPLSVGSSQLLVASCKLVARPDRMPKLLGGSCLEVAESHYQPVPFPTLQPDGEPAAKAGAVESELHSWGGGVTAKYKARFRTLHFNLKDVNNPDLRRRVLSGEIAAQVTVASDAVRCCFSDTPCQSDLVTAGFVTMQSCASCSSESRLSPFRSNDTSRCHALHRS